MKNRNWNSAVCSAIVLVCAAGSAAAPSSGVGVVGGAVVATVLGALGGAFAGNHIEGQVKASHSYEITVRLDDGSTRTLHQSELPGWQAGDRVKVVNGALRSIG